MADGTRFKTLETQIAQLTETVTVQMNHQIRQLTETVTSHSTSISDTTTLLIRMETLLSSLAHNSVTHGSTHGREQLFHVRNMHLEFPRFDGTDALAWIFKANQFFLSLQHAGSRANHHCSGSPRPHDGAVVSDDSTHSPISFMARIHESHRIGVLALSV